MVLEYHIRHRVHGDMALNIKNVILKDYVIRPCQPEGLEIINRREENGENYMSLTGTKGQINDYLQDKPILSERLRTLKNIPHYRIINTTKVEIY